MQTVAVDALFKEDGTIRVRRIKVDDVWYGVGQGRQWRDDIGHHVLVMFGDNTVCELVLRTQSLQWELKKIQGPGTAVV